MVAGARGSGLLGTRDLEGSVLGSWDRESGIGNRNSGRDVLVLVLAGFGVRGNKGDAVGVAESRGLPR